MDWTDVTKAILELVKAALWPATTLTIAIIFRSEIAGTVKEISEAVKRVRKAPGGFELDESKVLPQHPNVPTLGLVASAAVVSGVGGNDLPATDLPGGKIPPRVGEWIPDPPTLPNAWLDGAQKDLLKALKNENPTLMKFIGDGVAALISQSRALTHERTYRTIFGSQIKALRNLYAAGPAGYAVDVTEGIFSEARQAYPDLHKYGFEPWLQFLLAEGLVERRDSALRIMPRGEDFLDYMKEMRLADLKAY